MWQHKIQKYQILRNTKLTDAAQFSSLWPGAQYINLPIYDNFISKAKIASFPENSQIKENNYQTRASGMRKNLVYGRHRKALIDVDIAETGEAVNE